MRIMSLHSRLRDLLLAMQFGQAIHSGRIGRLILSPWRVARGAAKHIVGRDMHEGAIVGFHGLGEIPHGLCIEHFGKFGVGFRLVYVGVGRAVHYHLHIAVFHHLRHSIAIGDVELCHIGENIVVFASGGSVAHAVAKLAVCACHQYIHDFSSETFIDLFT